MTRVLVTEELAETRPRRACGPPASRSTSGSACRPRSCSTRVDGAPALVIRSATQVTAEVLEAGTDLVVVGRAGIGLDNVDVAAATRRGVMVVNAPQSNMLSAAEHTMALLLAAGPQRAAGRRRPQGRASGTGRGGRASSCTARRSASSASAASACSSRSAPRVRHAPRRVRPVRERRAGPASSACELVPDLERARRDRRLPHDPPAEDARDDRADRRRAARAGQARRCGSSTPPAAASSTRRRSPRRSASGAIAGAALDVFAKRADDRVAAVRRSSNVVVTPHLGASTVEAQDKAGETIAEMVVLALAGEFVPFAVNVAATRGARDGRARSCRSPSGSVACSPRLAGGARRRSSRSSYEGQIADYDCRVLTLVGAQGRARARRRRAGEPS